VVQSGWMTPVARLLLVALSAGAGCAEEPARTSRAALSLLGDGALAAQISSVALRIFDEGAACVGPNASGGSLLDEVELGLGETRTLAVSPGTRTFAASAFDGSSEVARGCTSAVLTAGESHAIEIDLVPLDPGGPDGGTDATEDCVDPIDLVDDFEDGVAAPHWTVEQTGGAIVQEIGGVLRIELPEAASVPSHGGYRSVVNHDMRDRRFFVEIPQMVNTSSGAAFVLVSFDPPGGPDRVELRQLGGTLEADLRIGNQTTTFATVSYDPAAHRWWQVIDEGGALALETSPDGMSFVRHGSIARPAFWSSVPIRLRAGTGALDLNPGVAAFDNVNGGGLFDPCP
jgi:hypothetical protein